MLNVMITLYTSNCTFSLLIADYKGRIIIIRSILLLFYFIFLTPLQQSLRAPTLVCFIAIYTHPLGHICQQHGFYCYTTNTGLFSLRAR